MLYKIVWNLLRPNPERMSAARELPSSPGCASLTTESRDTAADDTDAEHHEHPSVSLWVGEAFPDLAPLELWPVSHGTAFTVPELTSVLGSGVVEPDTLEGKELLLVREEAGFGRVAGQDEARRDDEDDGADMSAGLVRKGG
jgi:hypothetical protein